MEAEAVVEVSQVPHVRLQNLATRGCLHRPTNCSHHCSVMRSSPHERGSAPVGGESGKASPATTTNAIIRLVRKAPAAKQKPQRRWFHEENGGLYEEVVYTIEEVVYTIKNCKAREEAAAGASELR